VDAAMHHRILCDGTAATFMPEFARADRHRLSAETGDGNSGQPSPSASAPAAWRVFYKQLVIPGKTGVQPAG
jgi:hypothetical protein